VGQTLVRRIKRMVNLERPAALGQLAGDVEIATKKPLPLASTVKT
jgi:hypothetical protein